MHVCMYSPQPEEAESESEEPESESESESELESSSESDSDSDSELESTSPSAAVTFMKPYPILSILTCSTTESDKPLTHFSALLAPFFFPALGMPNQTLVILKGAINKDSMFLLTLKASK
mmetsp:Transcript_3216/g.4082  ORF Transcript_3216/g.4082 Transcript_3216/m.4082 type:complete len:120 (-) Transcript_3216:937-1296(-)